jgi:hypothetical protein
VITPTARRGRRGSLSLPARRLCCRAPCSCRRRGADYSGRAGEIAVAIAKGTDGRITALRVSRERRALWRLGRANAATPGLARTAVDELIGIAQREGVEATARVVHRRSEDEGIIEEIGR